MALNVPAPLPQRSQPSRAAPAAGAGAIPSSARANLAAAEKFALLFDFDRIQSMVEKISVCTSINDVYAIHVEFGDQITALKSLRAGFFNARGVKDQRVEIATFVRDHQLDVFLVQESLLKPSDRNPNIANYALVRNDRTRAAGGGTLIYYKRSLYCTPTDPPPLSLIEASVCRLAMTGHRPLYIVSTYIPPADQRANLQPDLEALFSLGDSVLLAGDFNAKHESWNCRVRNPRGRQLELLSSRLNFDVIAPMTPTHYPDCISYRPDILDMTLLKGVSLALRSIEVLQELDSDHRPVIISLGARVGPPDAGQPTPTKVITDWSKLGARLKSAKSPHLDAIPDNFTSSTDALSAIDSLTEHVQSTVNECSRSVPVTADTRWILPDDARDLLREKNASIRAYDSFPCEANRARMRSLQRAVKKRMRELRDAQWDKLLGQLEPNHQAFWQLQRKLRCCEDASTPPLNRPNQSLAFDDDEKAECLADSLEAQCTPSALPVDQAHLARVQAEVERRAALPPVEDPEYPLPPVTVDEVRSLIKDLNPRKAPGSDGVSSRVIKLFPPPLVILVTCIFNAALSNNLFPQKWKEAIVIGIPKPGKPKSEPSSYRPISLLKVLGKLYERVIYSRLMDFAESRSLIPDEQFGFRTEHSCVQQVHRIVECVSAGFQHGYLTGMLLFDVAKAFDKVWHDGLIFKLYSLEVPERLVHIIRDFLSDRSFRYRVEGTLSSPHAIRAGVPQGSVLSPLLFSLYSSDVPKGGKTQLALYADDTAILYTGRKPEAIGRVLQTAVDALGQWFAKWRIEVNPSKSAAILFCKRRTAPAPPPPITLFGEPIPWEQEAKYLGIILDRKLSFRQHIQKARNRAAFALFRLHGMLNKHSKLSLTCKLRIYTMCVRPIMTYGSAVFAHVPDSRLRRMQSLQNRFLRKATDAPWFMRNSQLHCDLKLPTIKQFMKRISIRFFDRAETHRNPLIVAAARYRPSCISRTKRPRHALAYPNDSITLLQEALAPKQTVNTPHKRSRHYRVRPRRRGPSRVVVNSNVNVAPPSLDNTGPSRSN